MSDTVQYITWADKQHIIPYGVREVQVWDLDMNEIKSSHNINADILADIQANQFTGFVAVKEYTDLPTPGVLSTGYMVLDDPDPTNNGMWGYDTAYYQASQTVNSGTFDDTDNVFSATQKSTADYIADYIVSREGWQLTSNLAVPINVLEDTYVNNNTGALQSIPGYKTMGIYNLKEGDVITFGGFTIDSQGNCSWYLGDTLVGLIQTYDNNEIPVTVTVPSGVDTLYYAFARDVNVPADYEFMMCNYGSELLPYETPNYWINSLGGIKLSAQNLPNDNIVPNPVTDENAVNLGYFNLNGIKDADLDLEPSSNLALPENVLEDTYVRNVTGELQSITGYKTMGIYNISEGDVITFGGFTINSQGNCSWYLGDTLVGLIQSYNNSQIPVTVTVPSGVDTLYYAFARDVNVPADYEFMMCNYGSTLLPYEEPGLYLVGIKEYPIKAQAVGDDIAYQNTDVSFTSIFTTGLQLDLPSGTTEPAGLEIYDAWVDTNDSTIKVKLS